MKITVEWFGVATFRLTVGELVIFLDAYMDRVPSAPPVGLRSEDVDRCDYVLIGHSHFDHLHGAQHIAKNTGAKIIGSNESARVLKGQGVPVEQLVRVQGGEHHRLSEDVTVRVYPSLHACTWVRFEGGMADGQFGHMGLCEDERAAVGGLNQQIGEAIAAGDEMALDLRNHLATSAGSLSAGGPLVFVIETPLGKIFYQDTSGCWTGVMRNLRAEVAILAASGRANWGGEPFQGSLVQFLVEEAKMLQPRTVILGHHDNWMPPVTSGIDDLTPVRQALRQGVPTAELREIEYCTPTRLLGSAA